MADTYGVSGRATSPEINAYLARLVKEELARGTQQQELAKRAGVTGAQISMLKNSGRGAGWKTMQGLAKAFGMTLAEVEAAARAQARGETAPTDSRVEYDERYPNRAVAVEMARKGGLSEHAIEGVQSMALKGADLEILEWFDLIRAEHRQAELGLPPRFPGQPVAVDEPGTVPKPPPPRKPAKR